MTQLKIVMMGFKFLKNLGLKKPGYYHLNKPPN
jgi:hypothetical protein